MTTPSYIEKRFKKIESLVDKETKAVADYIMKTRIIPFCDKKELSFFSYNGCLRFVDKNGDVVGYPNHIENLLMSTDLHGNPLYYWMDDYNPYNQDLNDIDRRIHEKQSQGREICEYLFSPFFR